MAWMTSTDDRHTPGTNWRYLWRRWRASGRITIELCNAVENVSCRDKCNDVESTPFNTWDSNSATSNNMKLVHWQLMGGYSEEGTWRGRSPPRSLLAVLNVTAHPSTATVPITVLLYNGPLLCGFNVPINTDAVLTASWICGLSYAVVWSPRLEYTTGRFWFWLRLFVTLLSRLCEKRLHLSLWNVQSRSLVVKTSCH